MHSRSRNDFVHVDSSDNSLNKSQHEFQGDSFNDVSSIDRKVTDSEVFSSLVKQQAVVRQESTGHRTQSGSLKTNSNASRAFENNSESEIVRLKSNRVFSYDRSKETDYLSVDRKKYQNSFKPIGRTSANRSNASLLLQLGLNWEDLNETMGQSVVPNLDNVFFRIKEASNTDTKLVLTNAILIWYDIALDNDNGMSESLTPHVIDIIDIIEDIIHKPDDAASFKKGYAFGMQVPGLHMAELLYLHNLNHPECFSGEESSSSRLQRLIDFFASLFRQPVSIAEKTELFDGSFATLSASTLRLDVLHLLFNCLPSGSVIEQSPFLKPWLTLPKVYGSIDISNNSTDSNSNQVSDRDAYTSKSSVYLHVQGTVNVLFEFLDSRSSLGVPASLRLRALATLRHLGITVPVLFRPPQVLCSLIEFVQEGYHELNFILRSDPAVFATFDGMDIFSRYSEFLLSFLGFDEVGTFIVDMANSIENEMCSHSLISCLPALVSELSATSMKRLLLGVLLSIALYHPGAFESDNITIITKKCLQHLIDVRANNTCEPTKSSSSNVNVLLSSKNQSSGKSENDGDINLLLLLCKFLASSSVGSHENAEAAFSCLINVAICISPRALILPNNSAAASSPVSSSNEPNVLIDLESSKLSRVKSCVLGAMNVAKDSLSPSMFTSKKSKYIVGIGFVSRRNEAADIEHLGFVDSHSQSHSQNRSSQLHPMHIFTKEVVGLMKNFGPCNVKACRELLTWSGKPRRASDDRRNSLQDQTMREFLESAGIVDADDVDGFLANLKEGTVRFTSFNDSMSQQFDRIQIVSSLTDDIRSSAADAAKLATLSSPAVVSPVVTASTGAFSPSDAGSAVKAVNLFGSSTTATAPTSTLPSDADPILSLFSTASNSGSSAGGVPNPLAPLDFSTSSSTSAPQFEKQYTKEEEDFFKYLKSIPVNAMVGSGTSATSASTSIAQKSESSAMSGSKSKSYLAEDSSKVLKDREVKLPEVGSAVDSYAADAVDSQDRRFYSERNPEKHANEEPYQSELPLLRPLGSYDQSNNRTRRDNEEQLSYSDGYDESRGYGFRNSRGYSRSANSSSVNNSYSYGNSYNGSSSGSGSGYDMDRSGREGEGRWFESEGRSRWKDHNRSGGHSGSDDNFAGSAYNNNINSNSHYSSSGSRSGRQLHHYHRKLHGAWSENAPEADDEAAAERKSGSWKEGSQGQRRYRRSDLSDSVDSGGAKRNSRSSSNSNNNQYTDNDNNSSHNSQDRLTEDSHDGFESQKLMSRSLDASKSPIWTR